MVSKQFSTYFLVLYVRSIHFEIPRTERVEVNIIKAYSWKKYVTIYLEITLGGKLSYPQLSEKKYENQQLAYFRILTYIDNIVIIHVINNRN